MKKRILITGGSGFIGGNFVKNKKNTYEIVAPNHDDLDILDIGKIRDVVKTYKPQIIINFAAHRDANTAEAQRGDKSGSAWQTNVIGVNNLCLANTAAKSFLIHISTDMVFSGSYNNPGPYKESDDPEKDEKKVSWYGFTKAEGERQLARAKNTAIIRIGNVTMPIYNPKLDYIGKIIYLYDKNLLYPLFYNQQLSLTWIQSLFEIIDKIILLKKTGIFHATSKNLFTPYDLAQYLISIKRKTIKKIDKISIDTFLKKNPNRYPKYGGLTGKKTVKILDTKLLTWQQIVDAFTL